jgi:hypothetical protein
VCGPCALIPGGPAVNDKRGLSYKEAIATSAWSAAPSSREVAPALVAMPQGSSLIFDRVDLDREFEEFPFEAARASKAAGGSSLQRNGNRNERLDTKADFGWAKQRGESTPLTTERGKTTRDGRKLDFASAAAEVMKMRKAKQSRG